MKIAKFLFIYFITFVFLYNAGIVAFLEINDLEWTYAVFSIIYGLYALYMMEK